MYAELTFSSLIFPFLIPQLSSLFSFLPLSCVFSCFLFNLSDNFARDIGMSEQSSSYGSVDVLLGKMFCITISSVGIFFFFFLGCLGHGNSSLQPPDYLLLNIFHLGYYLLEMGICLFYFLGFINENIIIECYGKCVTKDVPNLCICLIPFIWVWVSLRNLMQ